MGYRLELFLSLLELIYPEHCASCTAAKGTKPWCGSGRSLHGLWPGDTPHLCDECFCTLQEKSPALINLELATGALVPVLAAQWTNATLVDMVGAWKYKGVRGLVWPLSQLLIRVFDSQNFDAADIQWIPVPLHKRRQRERGFNQARLLADQLAAELGGTVWPEMVVRRRRTGQQAKINTTRERVNNMQDVFAWGRSQWPGTNTKIIIVDDLVTTGATAGSLVQFLAQKGLRVEAIACLGLAKPGAGS